MYLISTGNISEQRSLIKALEDTDRALLRIILTLLHHVNQNQKKNRMDHRELASVFAPAVLGYSMLNQLK